ncbi:MAG: MarR family transcriptional regulator [Bacteroidetes bacterium]|nr:MarR family transcriptional regulator [Bacteroidota bacterium]
MKDLTTYIKSVLGIEIDIKPLDKLMVNKLPMYLKEGYKWQEAFLMDRTCLLAELKEENAFGMAQIEKHIEQTKNTFDLPVIVIFNKLEAYNRKRLIERRVAFIIPNKQLYVPEFFIDLKDYNNAAPKETDKFTPIAQQLFLLHILDKHQSLLLEQKTFKELAVLLKTNAMAITRAAENLKQHEIIGVAEGKEKFLQFKSERHELWHNAMQRNLLVTPVIKRVYVDEMPDEHLLLCNASALPEYTDMNDVRQEFYAIEKNIFYKLQKKQALINMNEHEGKYCLEVWKYSPTLLSELEQPDAPVVDPLSLYLSLKDSQNERIEMALDQITDKYTW